MVAEPTGAGVTFRDCSALTKPLSSATEVSLPLRESIWATGLGRSCLAEALDPEDESSPPQAATPRAMTPEAASVAGSRWFMPVPARLRADRMPAGSRVARRRSARPVAQVERVVRVRPAQVEVPAARREVDDRRPGTAGHLAVQRPSAVRRADAQRRQSLWRPARHPEDL